MNTLPLSRFESHLIENREIRFFLSSTFADMDNERTALVQLFQKLRIVANKRNVMLSVIDLRWGVTEEESRSGKVLSVCLNEIEHSHPFFIGLLGSRYGSTPKATELLKNPDLAERYPWIGKDIERGLSITEIEMQYGVLRNRDHIDAAFFIKKTPNTLPDDDEKLTNLKEKIRELKRFPVEDYTSMDDLCTKVEGAVLNILDKYFPNEDTTILGKVRLEQKAYMNSRHNYYVKNQAGFDHLNTFLNNGEQNLVITGPSGIGKSALVANWIKEVSEHKLYNIIHYFIGNYDASNDYQQILRYLCDEIYDRFHLKRMELNKESVEAESQRLITELGQKEIPLLIVIDGINQIVEEGNSKLLNWLPQASGKVKFLFTTLEDDDTMDTFQRCGYPIKVIKPLRKTQRKKFAKQYLAYVGKKLDETQLLEIISDPECKNMLVLKTLLDELICFGTYRKLRCRIKYYLSAPSIESFFNRVLKRMEEDYSDKQDLVRHGLSLIAVSEQGLTEEELISIMGVRQIDWYLFYCAFYNHFVTKQGKITFSHQYVADAIMKRYKLEKPQYADPYRHEIILHFEKECDKDDKNRRISELSYQYYHTNDDQNLYRTILSFEAFIHYCNTNLTPFAHYWRKLLKNAPDTYQLRDYQTLPSDDIKATELPYLNLGLFTNYYFSDSHLAIDFFKINIQKSQKALSPDHPHIAAAYNNIGTSYENLGEYKTAQDYYFKALAMSVKINGENHPDTATVYNNIGSIFGDMDKFDEALDYHLKALSIHINTFGKKHPDVATDYNNIGMTYYDMGEFTPAEENLQKAVSISEDVQGLEHFDTATYINNLGAVYAFVGETDNALEKYCLALTIRLHVLGLMHPDTASSLNNIGMVKYDQEYYYDALGFFSRAKMINERVCGKEHPDTAASYNNMGLAFHSLGDYSKAYRYYSKALAIRLKILGEWNQETAYSYNNIGVLYRNRRQYKKALEFLNRGLKIREKVLGPDHPDTAMSYQNIGDVYAEQKGGYPLAMEQYTKALEIFRKSFQDNHPSILELLGKMKQ